MESESESRSSPSKIDIPEEIEVATESNTINNEQLHVLVLALEHFLRRSLSRPDPLFS